MKANTDKDPYQITFQSWDQLAQAYQDRFMDIDLYDDTYDAFCSLIEKPNPRIFEIGCGPGNITRYLLSKRPDFELEAIDIAPSMVELARKNIPGARFEVMDCRDINRLNATFDGILCGFCMPYLSKEDCAKLIRDCAARLNPGGALYLSAIEGEYSKSGYITGSTGHEMYLYYHQENYFQQCLEASGLERINLVRKDFTQKDEAISTHMIFLSKRP